jgi:hypothetical protein
VVEEAILAAVEPLFYHTARLFPFSATFFWLLFGFPFPSSEMRAGPDSLIPRHFHHQHGVRSITPSPHPSAIVQPYPTKVHL